MIILTDLMLEAKRLHDRASKDRKPVDSERLAILSGAEIVTKNQVAALLPDAHGILNVVKTVEEDGAPAVLLIDTGTATRDAIVLLNTLPTDIAGRALTALALSHSALEPAARPIPGSKSRIVVISLPATTIHDREGQTVCEVGTPVRHDPSGASVAFRPMAEMGVNRLALSLLVMESEIHNTAEWIGAGTEEDREERLSDMLSLRAGVPSDWIKTAVRRYAGRVLTANPASGKKKAA